VLNTGTATSTGIQKTQNATHPALFLKGGEYLLDDNGVEGLELTRQPHFIVHPENKKTFYRITD
jgi:hypothetical protein